MRTGAGLYKHNHHLVETPSFVCPAAQNGRVATWPKRCGRIRRPLTVPRAASTLPGTNSRVPSVPPIPSPSSAAASTSGTWREASPNGASKSYTTATGSLNGTNPLSSAINNNGYPSGSSNGAATAASSAGRSITSSNGGPDGDGAPARPSPSPSYRAPTLLPTADLQQQQQKGQQQQPPRSSAAPQQQQQGPGEPDDEDASDIEIPEFMEPSVYNAAMNSRYWETRPVRVLARMLRIGLEFGGWAAGCRARGLRLRDAAAQEAAAAEALKDVLVRLGPAFVKIGQALSSRPDVLPPPYIAALEALQDRIPPFPDAAAMEVLEAELGAPPSAVFARLSPRPVAAASLGQVYRGALRAELGGGEVAVKVQRPRVAQMIAQDVYILRLLAGWLRTARRLNTDLPALVDEWASSLFRELNYRIEADNAVRFKQLFSHLPQVYVPHIYDQLTTAKVLTMEWIDGERLRTAGASAAERGSAPTSSPSSSRIPSASTSAPSPPSLPAARRSEDLALVEVGVRCSLEQMLEEGFYHADPHPGNLLRTPDGRLAYLDFGMMGQIDERTRTALMTATLHLVNREYGRLAEDFVTLGFLPAGTDREAVLPELTAVFSDALKGGVSNLSFGQLSGNLGATMYKYSFRIPPYYTLLVRSLSVLEGIALASDPNYKVLGSAYPWIARRLLTDPSPDLRQALRRLLYSGEGRFRFDRLESLLRQAAKSANRLKRPAVPTAPQQPSQQQQPATSTTNSTTASSSTTTTVSAGVSSINSSSGSTTSTTSSSSSSSSGGGALALLLSPDGEFVRGILLDEVAKGIDGAWRIAADATLASVRQTITNLPSAALPVLSLLPGGSLIAAALLATTASSSSSSSSQIGSSSGAGGAGPADGGSSSSGNGGRAAVAVQRSLSAALARLPALATEDDRAQVAGLLQLGNALADVAGLKLPALLSPSASSPAAATTASAPTAAAATASTLSQSSATPADGPSTSSSELFEAAAQAAEAVRWLAAEAAELPREARGELLQLPLQLGRRVASRVTARALRSLVLGAGTEGAGELEAGGAAPAPTPAAPLVPPAGP